MAHWFDDLTTNLARVDRAPPRRSFLRMIGAAVGAGVVARASFPADALAQSTTGQEDSRANQQARTGQHLWTANGGHPRRARSVVRPGRLDAAPAIVLRSPDEERLDEHDGQPWTEHDLSRWMSRRQGEAGQRAVASYGADVQGIKSVTMTSKDGRAFQGSLMDALSRRAGRPALLDDVQFFDGQRAPEIVLDPKLGAAIDDLTAKAGKSFPPVREKTPPTSPRESRTSLRKRRAKPVPGSAGEDWYEPGDDFIDCMHCEDTCNQVFVDSQWGVFATAWCPPCAVKADATALLVYAGCMGICNLPGGGCLPVRAEPHHLRDRRYLLRFRRRPTNVVRRRRPFARISAAART